MTSDGSVYFASNDVPITSFEQDSFSIQHYVESLCSFIRSAQTPITISIQGEWGSGKTSFMRMIEASLCDPALPLDERFEAIWLDTWSLFLEDDQERASVKLLTSLISQIGNHLDAYSSKERSERGISTTKQSLRALSKVVLSVANVSPESVDSLWDTLDGSGTSSAASLKERLGELISQEVTARDNAVTNRGFLIFIDDLDRLSPRLAVSLLETVKNLFDVKYCVFILAIDFDIVKLGVEQKYGTAQIRGRDVAQEFFDKIIQASFSVPVQKYNVMPLILGRLRELSLFANPTQYSLRRSTIKSIMLAATNKNPRAIKSTLNALQILLNIMRTDALQTPYRLMVLSLVALEKTFPRVYEALAKSPVLAGASGGREADVEDVASLSQLLVRDEDLRKLLAADDLMGSMAKRARILVDEFAKLAMECWEDDIPFDDLFDAIGLVNGDTSASTEIRFSGTEYDAFSTTQRTQGARLLDLIDFSEHKNVLDLGCGNGRTTIEMWRRNPAMWVDAVDISESQIETALANYQEAREEMAASDTPATGHIEFQILNFDRVHALARYDLVFSNSALHWLSNPKDGYARLYRALEPGGLLAVHQGGAGTYRGLHALARRAVEEAGLAERYEGWSFPANYPTAEAMHEMLVDIGFENVNVQSVEIETKDASPTLPKDFAAASLIFYQIPSVTNEEFEKVEEIFERLCAETNPDLYAHRLYIFATKPR